MRWRLPVALAFALSTLAVAPRAALAEHGLERTLSPAKTAHKLETLWQTIATMKAAGQRPVVVFDIDDTLLRSPRPGSQGGPVLTRAVPGAAAYVRSLAALGAHVVYLTGRPEKGTNRQETMAQLARFGFPVQNTTLRLNDTKLSPLEFKRSVLPDLHRLGTPAAFFDNEMENVRMFRSEMPAHVPVFRPDTHSTRPDPGPHAGPGARGPVYVIHDFAPHGVPMRAPLARR